MAVRSDAASFALGLARLVAVAGALALAGCTPTSGPAKASGARAEDVRRPLPTTTVVGLDGTSASLADVVRGRVTVLDLWASWCTACRATSARVARLAKIYAEADLLVVGLDVGEDRETVAAFLEGGLPPHPVYLDPDFRFADALGRRELPAVVFVDRHGTVRRVASTLDESGIDLARTLLAEP